MVAGTGVDDQSGGLSTTITAVSSCTTTNSTSGSAAAARPRAAEPDRRRPPAAARNLLVAGIPSTRTPPSRITPAAIDRLTSARRRCGRVARRRRGDHLVQFAGVLSVHRRSPSRCCPSIRVVVSNPPVDPIRPDPIGLIRSGRLIRRPTGDDQTSIRRAPAHHRPGRRRWRHQQRRPDDDATSATLKIGQNWTSMKSTPPSIQRLPRNNRSTTLPSAPPAISQRPPAAAWLRRVPRRSGRHADDHQRSARSSAPSRHPTRTPCRC